MIWKAYEVKNKLNIYEFYSIHESTFDENFVFPGESHGFWECVYVEDGSICVTADDKIYNLTKGEIIFHKPYEFHKFTVEKKTKLFIFSFSMEGEFTNHFRNKIFLLSPQQKSFINNLITYMKSQLDEMDINPTEQNDEQGDMFLKPFEEISAYSQILTNQIYSLFFSLLDSKTKDYSINNYDSAIYKKALIYMNNMISENLSLPEIAEKAETSVSTLKRIFKKYTGYSVHKFFLMQKLNYASALLKSGITVTEVATRLGFSSQGYFSKVFQRELGYPPSSLHGNSKA